MSFIDLFKSRESREKLSHLKNLVAVAFADGKLEDNQDALLKETPLKLPVKRVNLDEDEALQTKYNIRVWPVFVLVDSNGKELHRWQGLSKGEEINTDLHNIIGI